MRRRTAWLGRVFTPALVATALVAPIVMPVVVPLVASVAIAPAARADDSSGPAMTEGPDGILGIVQPTGARSGEMITVNLSDWPASVQVQAVICGQLAVGGSNSCYLPGAALGRIDEGGDALLQLKVHAPPKPCPCVVRVRSFSGDVLALDLPFDVVGHRRGKVPAPRSDRAADVAVTGVRVEDTVGLRSLFGLGGRARVVATVTNRGYADGPAPALEYGLGEDWTGTVTPDLVVPARQSREIEIDVSLGLGAIGAHHARVRVADTSNEATEVTWRTYPWGWLLAAVSVVVAMALRLGARRWRAAAQPADDYPLPDVVWVEEIGALLVNPAAVRRSRLLRRVGGRIRPADLGRIVPVARVEAPVGGPGQGAE